VTVARVAAAIGAHVFEDAVARYFTARLHDAHDLTVTRLFRIPGGASRET
jgi:hypothetical protein